MSVPIAPVPREHDTQGWSLDPGRARGARHREPRGLRASRTGERGAPVRAHASLRRVHRTRLRRSGSPRGSTSNTRRHSLMRGLHPVRHPASRRCIFGAPRFASCTARRPSTGPFEGSRCPHRAPAEGLPALRPLSDDEIALGRSFACNSLSATREPAAWALSEAGARSSELPYIRVCDVYLDAGRVFIVGGTKTTARWGDLTTWGLVQLRRRLDVLDDRGHEALLICADVADRTRARANAYEAVPPPSSALDSALSPASVRTRSSPGAAHRRTMPAHRSQRSRTCSASGASMRRRRSSAGIGAQRTSDEARSRSARVPRQGRSDPSQPRAVRTRQGHPARGQVRPSRTYPDYMVLVFSSLVSVWRSARQVEAELAHPLVWGFMRRIVAELFPDEPTMQLPPRPMKRHHFTYFRERYVTVRSS